MSHGSESSDRCFKHKAHTSPALVQNGKLVLQPYHIGFIISGSLGFVAIVTSFWLVSKHLRWYTNKREQRYIVRILFMVPIYALISFLSFLFWNHSTPIILVRDAYEALVLTAFFYLLLMYLSHDPEEQKRIFVKSGLSREADAIALQKGLEIEKWVLPLGFVKWKPKDGLYFLQLMKWGVLQYCVIRPTSTLAAVILDYIGLYCESSWGLGWGHIYITIIMSLSVTIAMYCLIQLYVPVAKDLAQHKPLLKLFSIKAVVFLTFWQATFLSVMSMFGIVKDNKYMTAEDVNIGIGAVAECFEMMLFGFIHIVAFSYKPYCEPNFRGEVPQPTLQWRSLGHVMDFRETFREIWVGCVYMFDQVRGREPTPDLGIIRENHYQGAFGKSIRPQANTFTNRPETQKTYTLDDVSYPRFVVNVEEKVEVDIDGRRQWLILERDRVRNLSHPGREKSEGLLEQFDKELGKLGYAKDDISSPKDVHQDAQPDRRQRSWWRSVYNRISQSGPDIEEEERQPLSQPKRHSSSRWRPSRQVTEQGDTLRLERVNERDIDDRPPPSILTPHNTNTRKLQSNAIPNYIHHQNRDEDPLPFTLNNADDSLPLPLRFGDISRYGTPHNDRHRQPPHGNAIIPQQASSSSHPRAFDSLPRIYAAQTNSQSPRRSGPALAPASPRLEIRCSPPLTFSSSAAFPGGMSGPRAPVTSPTPWPPQQTQIQATPPPMRIMPAPARRRPNVVPVMPPPLASSDAGASTGMYAVSRAARAAGDFEYAWSPPRSMESALQPLIPDEDGMKTHYLRLQDQHVETFGSSPSQSQSQSLPHRRSTHRREPAAPSPRI